MQKRISAYNTSHIFFQQEEAHEEETTEKDEGEEEEGKSMINISEDTG